MSGRSLSNSVINLGIRDQYAEALSQLGFEFEVLAEQVSTTTGFIPCFSSEKKKNSVNPKNYLYL